MKQLIKKIEKLAADRDIHTITPIMQTTEILEEAVKLQQGIIRNDVLEIKDAIGDIFISLVSLSLQDEKTTVKLSHFNNYVHDVKVEMNELLKSICKLQEMLIEKDYYRLKNHSQSIIIIINGIAIKYGFTLKDCVEYAYNNIKDRKGSIVNGMYVKEEAKKDTEDIEQMIRDLRHVAKQHENVKLYTFDTDINAMCKDVISLLDRLK